MAMRELTLKNHEAPKLKVNNHVFELQMSDHELMFMSSNLQKKYQAINKNTPDEEILAAVEDVAAGIDKILGAGAMAKISDGKPVSLVTAIQWLKLITQEAMECYADELAASYE